MRGMLGFSMSPLPAAIRLNGTSSINDEVLIERSIFNFNSTQYGKLAQPIDIDTSQDYEVELLLSKPHTGGGTFISGVDGYRSALIVDLNSDIFRVFAYTESGSLIPDSIISLSLEQTDNICDGRIHTIGLHYSDGLMEVHLDGVLVKSADWSAYSGILQIGTIMARGHDGERISSGNLYGIRVWTGGDKASGQLIADYRIDEPDTVYQRDYANPLTENILPQGNFIDPAEWSPFGNLGPSSIVGGGQLRVERVDSYAGFYTPLYVEEGKSYLITCDVVAEEGATPVLAIRTGTSGGGDNIGSDSYTEDGKLYILYEADATLNRYITPAAGTSSGAVTYSNMIVREFNGLALQNALPGDWEAMVKSPVKNFWLGAEYVGAELNTSGLSYVGDDGVLHMARVSGQIGGVNIIGSADLIEEGRQYLNKIEYRRYTGIHQEITGFRAGSYGSYSLTSYFPTPPEGDFSWQQLEAVVKANTGNEVTLLSPSDNSGADIRNISIRRYLEYAEGAI